MRSLAFLSALLVAGCAAPAPEAVSAHDGHAQPHACTPPEVAADPADALTHTPHTPGRPQVRYYVVSDA